MSDVVQSAAVYAAIIVTIVQAIRARWTALDGWYVPLLAFGISILVCAVVGNWEPYSRVSVWEMFRTAIVSCVIAVGGDAWVAKVATKVGGG